MLLRIRFQQVEGLLVDVHQAHLAHAGIREIGMRLQVRFQRADALPAEFVKQAPDAAEIFLPKGNGGIFEQVLKMIPGPR